jgi:hypothetical protein
MTSSHGPTVSPLAHVAYALLGHARKSTLVALRACVLPDRALRSCRSGTCSLEIPDGLRRIYERLPYEQLIREGIYALIEIAGTSMHKSQLAIPQPPGPVRVLPASLPILGVQPARNPHRALASGPLAARCSSRSWAPFCAVVSHSSFSARSRAFFAPRR